MSGAIVVGGSGPSMSTDVRAESSMPLVDVANDDRVDGLPSPQATPAALEPGSAPAQHGQVRHIGVDIDTRHEAATEPEPPGDRVVVDLVLRLFRRVEGFDAVRAQIGFSMQFGHGLDSSRRL